MISDESIKMHDLIDIILTVLDARDPYTSEHSERVACLSELIARKMGIAEEWVQMIHVAAHLHDIGKVGVPDFVLNKTGKLTVSEFDLMKSHPRIGFNIMKQHPILEEISLYILYHHERWDGRGYPEGIGGKEIPLGARIIAVSDTFDAITSSRSYRSSRTIEQAFEEIRNCASTQFCPEVVECFLSLKNGIPAILTELNENIQHLAFCKQESSIKTRSYLSS